MFLRKAFLSSGICLAVAATMTWAVAAQNTPAAGTSAKHPQRSQAKASMPAMSMMAKPGPEIEKVNKLLGGKWTTTEKFEPSDFMPQGGSGSGMEQMHPGPGGLSLIADYQSKPGPMGAFRGHGVMTWDPKEQAYKSYWFDNMTAGSFVETGKWEGDNLVFTGDMEMMGKKMSLRQVYTDIKPSSFTWYEESSTDGGPTKRVMTLTYKKAGAAAKNTVAGKD
jgi:Protein of unknown function (DUF1579)